jgi:hypothetical protein
VNEHFSPHRVGRLLWMDILGRYRAIFMTTAVFAALIIVTSTVAVLVNRPEAKIMDFWFLVMALGWAAVESSFSFRELHDKSRNEAFLLVPASALEKTLSRLLIATVGLGVYIVVFTLVMTVINDVLVRALANVQASSIDFFNAWTLTAIGCFIVNQSLYFLGAAWFRRWHFVKMALVLNTVPTALSWIAVLAFALLFSNFQVPSEAQINEFVVLYSGFVLPLWTFAKIFFFAVIPVFCWVVAWMRVRETQVSYGI